MYKISKIKHQIFEKRNKVDTYQGNFIIKKKLQVTTLKMQKDKTFMHLNKCRSYKLICPPII